MLKSSIAAICVDGANSKLRSFSSRRKSLPLQLYLMNLSQKTASMTMVYKRSVLLIISIACYHYIHLSGNELNHLLAAQNAVGSYYRI